jgi:hypothetical protein
MLATYPQLAVWSRGKTTKGNAMPKMELSLTDDEKELIRFAADKEKLRPATWAKAKLLMMAHDALPVQVKP